ncbi:egl nine 3 [Crotalus adamanteus]|uniref:Egl nine 3 n=1 Tax=Crotalus adamanteus TaxID=8729 RepID=A0AAW1C777_CROAD
MASGREATVQPPTELSGDSVESMRKIFIGHPESSEDGDRAGRKEQLDGPERGSLGALLSPGNSGEVRVAEGALPSGPSPPKRAPVREHRRDAQRLVLHYIVPCMNAYGLCVVDHFLGSRIAEKIFQEVLALHLSDKFQDGALASQKLGSNKAIRGDKILWVEGSEPGCENIGYLLKKMDKLIMYADGKLGHYKIRGRHKALSAERQVWKKEKPPSGGKMLSTCKLNPSRV